MTGRAWALIAVTAAVAGLAPVVAEAQNHDFTITVGQPSASSGTTTAGSFGFDDTLRTTSITTRGSITPASQTWNPNPSVRGLTQQIRVAKLICERVLPGNTQSRIVFNLWDRSSLNVPEGWTFVLKVQDESFNGVAEMPLNNITTAPYADWEFGVGRGGFAVGADCHNAAAWGIGRTRTLEVIARAPAGWVDRTADVTIQPDGDWTTFEEGGPAVRANIHIGDHNSYEHPANVFYTWRSNPAAGHVDGYHLQDGEDNFPVVGLLKKVRIPLPEDGAPPIPTTPGDQGDSTVTIQIKEIRGVNGLLEPNDDTRLRIGEPSSQTLTILDSEPAPQDYGMIFLEHSSQRVLAGKEACFNVRSEETTPARVIGTPPGPTWRAGAVAGSG